MRKKLLISLVIILSICVFEITRPKLNLAEQTKQIVKIQVESEYGEWEGTGVFVADDLILTAGHIVDGAKKITITFVDGRKHRAFDWYKETGVDLGVVAIGTLEKEPTATFANAVVGETVWAIGNPFGVLPVVTKGIVSAIDMPDDFSHTKNMIITDCPANAGNSGCPLLNKHGDILGICSWGYNCSQGMSYFVRAEVCRASLAKYRTTKTLERLK